MSLLRQRWHVLTAVLLLLTVVMAATFTAAPAPSAQAAAPTSRSTIVHLFEWKWPDIAKECENWLGPKGFAAVQVSPPEEHAQVAGSPWWERYQPVSYQINSRSGTRAQFADMVSRCKAVGVDVYVDAVINHMSGIADGSTGTSNLGNSYTHYSYVGVPYGNSDFHHCGRNGTDDISNYNDRYEVQNCELVNLADLNTGSSYVQGKISGYLNDLKSLGVTGFRIDAAKHMDAGELHTILGQAGNPYVYQEVIEDSGPIQPSEYFQNGDVIEFRYADNISSAFQSGQIKNLSNFGTAWGFIDGSKAQVFVDNHDDQRTSGHLSYKSGTTYNLAEAFMLAWPYGYPEVMSSFAFTSSDQSPPADSNGNTNDIYPSGSSTPNCLAESAAPGAGSGWVCEQRRTIIANMVGFRNYTNSSTTVTNWWDDGNNQIAFGRGSAGYIAINREGSALNRTFQTSLPAGTYCDVTKGQLSASGTSCTGPTVTVNNAGQFTATVAAMDALAIHGGAKISGGTPTPTPTPGGPTATPTPTVVTGGTIPVTFNANVTTTLGQNVYVSGDNAALGGWNTANAVPLSSANYPIWSATVNLPANTAIQYKYIIKDGSGNVTWEGGSNRTFTVPASGTLTRNDTWNQASSATPTPTATPKPATPTPTATPKPATPTPTPSSGNVAVTFNANVTTVVGQNVYVSGNIAALGGWNTANAMLLSSANYPTWSAMINLPANTAVQYKYIKKDGSGNVTWEGGSNRTFTVPASGTLTRNDSWQN